MTHTWIFNQGHDGAVISNDHGAVAIIPMDLTAWRKHARLIAAAPKMLDALEQIEQQLDYGQISMALKIARLIIAEAKGE